MEMTTLMSSRFLLRWSLVVVVRRKCSLGRWRRPVRHRWQRLKFTLHYFRFHNAYACLFFFLFGTFGLWATLSLTLIIQWLVLSNLYKIFEFRNVSNLEIHVYIWIMEYKYNFIHITWEFIFCGSLLTTIPNIEDEFKPFILEININY